MSGLNIMNNLTEEELARQCSCPACDWEGKASEVKPEISNADARLDPGSEVPVGECPKCGTLCYFIDNALPDAVRAIKEADVWGEDPNNPRSHWREEVAGGNVNSGYWEWVAARYAEAAAPRPMTSGEKWLDAMSRNENIGGDHDHSMDH